MSEPLTAEEEAARQAEAARTAIPSSEAVPAEDGLRELRALSEAATPGPWGAYISYSGESGTPDEAGLFVNDKAHDVDGEKQTIISDFSLYASEHLPDLEFIVAAVNYVRAALASTERAATPSSEEPGPAMAQRLSVPRLGTANNAMLPLTPATEEARSDAGDGLDVGLLARALEVVDDMDILPSLHAAEVAAEYTRLAKDPTDEPEGIVQRAHVACSHCWCGEHHEEGR